MIDTIKFKITVNEATYNNIKAKSINIKKTHPFIDYPIFNYFTSNINVPSYSRGLNIFINDSTPLAFFLEFSIPKFIYNHNFYNIDSCIAYSALLQVHKLLRSFGNIPTIESWEILKIHLCWNWWLNSQDDVRIAIDSLQTRIPSRMKKLYYTDSTYSYSDSVTIKFYNKKLEFRNHDLKHLASIAGNEYAYDLLKVSENILRFEVELKKLRILRANFNTDILSTHYILNDELLYKVLNKYFNKQVNDQFNFNSNNEIYKKLLSHCRTGSLAWQLFSFYKVYYSYNENDRLFCLTSLSPRTIRRNKKILKDAGVSLLIPSSSDLSYLQFTIPSPNNPNNYITRADAPQERRHTKT